MAVRRKASEERSAMPGQTQKTGAGRAEKELEHYSKVKFGELTYGHARMWRSENPVDDKNISSVTTNALMDEVTRGDIRGMRRRERFLNGVKKVLPDGKLESVNVDMPALKITKEDVAEYRKSHPRHVEWLNRLNRAALENVVSMRRMKSSLRLNGKSMQAVLAKVEKENRTLIDKIREDNANVIEPFRSIRTNRAIREVAGAMGSMHV